MKGRPAPGPAIRPSAAWRETHAARRVCCVVRRRARLLDQARHDPRLGLEIGGFADLDDIAELALACSSSWAWYARTRDDLAVQLVLVAALDEHGDVLALVADDLADEGAGTSPSRGFGRSFGGLPFLLGQDGLGATMSRRVLPGMRMVVQLLGGLLHAQAEVGLEQVGDFFSRPATSLARSSDAFIVVLRGPGRRPGARRRWCFSGSLPKPAERLARQCLGHAVDLVEHLARLDLGHVVLRLPLPLPMRTSAGFCEIGLSGRCG